MKKNIFGGLFFAVVALSVFASCLNDVGNKFTLTQLVCTVVSVDNGRVTVQIDALGAYYFADEFIGKDMEKGERYLLEKMTVNNDEQPAGAMGTLVAPVKMTEVGQTTLIKTDNVIRPQDEEGLANDSIEYFFAPYINISTFGPFDERAFITFSGGVKKSTKPDFRLVFKERLADATNSGKDTICYEFKAKNTAPEEKGNMDSFAQCFRLQEPMASEQIVKIYFYGKKYQANEVNSIKPSYCVVKAPKKNTNN